MLDPPRDHTPVVAFDLADESGQRFRDRYEFSSKDSFDTGARLGSGCSASVYVVRDRTTGEQAACKLAQRRPNLRWSHLQSHFAREVALLRQCAHPNVVGVRCLYQGSEHLAIVLELVVGGDLQQLLKRHGALAEPAVHTIMAQLFSALGYVHSRGILHRDVKLENILVTTAASPQIKLCDFGHSCSTERDTVADNFRGTEGYQAPELAEGPNWSTAADVFSAGVVMHALLANYLLRWSMGQPDLRGRSFGRVSTPTKLLLKALIRLDPPERATVVQVSSALAEIDARRRGLARPEQPPHPTPPVSADHATPTQPQPPRALAPLAGPSAAPLRGLLGQHAYSLRDITSLEHGASAMLSPDLSTSVAQPRAAWCDSPASTPATSRRGSNATTPVSSRRGSNATTPLVGATSRDGGGATPGAAPPLELRIAHDGDSSLLAGSAARHVAAATASSPPIGGAVVASPSGSFGSTASTASASAAFSLAPTSSAFGAAATASPATLAAAAVAATARYAHVFAVTKHSWRGTYERLLCFDALGGVQTLDPSSPGGAPTNAWRPCDVLGAALLDGKHSSDGVDQGFSLLVACGGPLFCGLFVRRLQFSAPRGQRDAIRSALRAATARRLGASPPPGTAAFFAPAAATAAVAPAALVPLRVAAVAMPPSASRASAFACSPVAEAATAEAGMAEAVKVEAPLPPPLVTKPAAPTARPAGLGLRRSVQTSISCGQGMDLLGGQGSASLGGLYGDGPAAGAAPPSLGGGRVAAAPLSAQQQARIEGMRLSMMKIRAAPVAAPVAAPPPRPASAASATGGEARNGHAGGS